MNNADRLILLEKAKQFFRNEIVEAHIIGACERASKLTNYNVNLFCISI